MMNNDLKVNQNSPEFVRWFAGVEELVNGYMLKHFPALSPEARRMSFSEGPRYIRVMQDNSAYAFIDRRNGDVLKPASFRAPAKHARGNLFAPDFGLPCAGPYGIAYLR